jgi:uncharacterized protein (TIGR02271 family)
MVPASDQAIWITDGTASFAWSCFAMSEPTTIQVDDQHIELLEERLEIDKRVVTLGRVFVDTKVETEQHVVEAMLQHDEVDIQRVPIGQIIDSRPPIRNEDDVVIVPIVEERLVVEVQLFLKEELRVSKSVVAEKVSRIVPLRSEHATINRTDEPPASPPAIEGKVL